MKPFLLYLFVFLSGTVGAQTECTYYQKYIDRGNNHLANQNFKEAINAYSIALVYCPEKTNETWALIMVAFQKIEDLKDEAKENERKAVENEQKAIQAKLISDAYKYIFFAQEAAKNDPMLALHLTDSALNLFKSANSTDKNDSSVYEKALRIYYENNFGETLIDKENFPVIKGNLTQATYAPDGKTIWTLTDSAYAYQWNSSGKLMDSIMLDASLKKYEFKQSMEGEILIHGRDESKRYPSGKIWKLQKNAASINIPSNENPVRLIGIKDSIIYQVNRDSSENWAKRLFVFGSRAFHLTKDGRLSPVISETSIEIGLIAFSPNGKFVAVSGESPEVKIFNVNGSFIRRIGTGNKPVSMEFSHDNNILAVNNRITLRLFDLKGKLDNNSGTVSETTFNLQGYPLQTYTFSPDGKMMLLSFSNRTQQISRLYKKNTNNWSFSEFAKFTCIGSPSTSASFSNNPGEIITSSDKVRVWKIPGDRTVPQHLSNMYIDSNSYFSVEHNLEENLIYGYSLAGKKIKFNLDGSKITTPYPDSTYLPDSVTNNITAFIPGIKKAVIVSENGDLNMFHLKQPMEAYLKTFRFEPFTEAQKRKYGIK